LQSEIGKHFSGKLYQIGTKLAPFYSAEMKLDQKRYYSFLWKNGKYTWSDVQKLAITHREYNLICENVCEQSFLKSVGRFGLFGRFLPVLGRGVKLKEARDQDRSFSCILSAKGFYSCLLSSIFMRRCFDSLVCHQKCSVRFSGSLDIGSAGLVSLFLVQDIPEWVWFQLLLC